jgi:hypothetical protein
LLFFFKMYFQLVSDCSFCGWLIFIVVSECKLLLDQSGGVVLNIFGQFDGFIHLHGRFYQVHYFWMALKQTTIFSYNFTNCIVLYYKCKFSCLYFAVDDL